MLGILTRRDFVHAGCTAGIVSLAPHFLDRAEAGLHFHGTLPTYEGLVASRARFVINTNDATNKFMMSRSGHVATEALSSIKFAFANFSLTGAREQGNGAASTITASVEYPAGTFTQIKFAGSSSGSIPDADLIFSDFVTVSIPLGATFWVRSFISNTAGLSYNTWQSTFFGEATTLSATSISDQTLGGTITNSGAFSFPPVAILGLTTNPSVMIVGDSIALGLTAGDTEDSSNTATGFNAKVGIVARSMGNVPFVNMARFGEQAAGWSGGAAARAKLIQKSSHVFCEMGINDLHAGSSSATLITALQAIYALTGSWQKVYQNTLTPFSSSTDAFATLANQTTDVSNAARVAFNTSLRTGGVTGQNFKGFVETADVLESSRNSGLWIVTPSPPYTTDGIHPDVAGYAVVAAANVYPPIVFP